MRLKRWRLWAIAGTALLSSASSCDDPRALVLVDVSASVEFTDVRLTVHANQSTTVSFDHVHLDASTVYPIGLYLPSDVAGTVDLEAEVVEGDCVSGTGHATATGVASGKTTAKVSLVIDPTRDGCVAPGGGSGGSAGSAGPAGAGGAPSGAGGEVGAGGAAGHGMVAAPGDAGSAGTAAGGATAGSSGLAGTTGGAGGRAGGHGGASPGGNGGGNAGTTGEGGRGAMGGTAGPGSAGTSGGAGTSGSTGAGGTPAIQVVAQCQSTAGGTTSILVHFKILNLSNVSVPFSTITARYFYTLEDPAMTLPIVEFDYLQSISKTAVTTKATATYVEFGFTTAAGTLQAFDNISGSGEIQVRIHPPNYTPTAWDTDQTNDPSYTGCTTSSTNPSYEPRTSFVGYVSGQQSWPAP
jgi:hypothetical protein